MNIKTLRKKVGEIVGYVMGIMLTFNVGILTVAKVNNLDPIVPFLSILIYDLSTAIFLWYVIDKCIKCLERPYPYNKNKKEPMYREKRKTMFRETEQDYIQEINKQLHQINDLKKKVNAYEVSNAALKQYIRNLEAEQGKRVRKTKNVYEVGVVVKANRGKEVTLPQESNEPKRYTGSSSKKIEFL